MTVARMSFLPLRNVTHAFQYDIRVSRFLGERASKSQKVSALRPSNSGDENVRHWHKADITRLSSNVRFWVKQTLIGRAPMSAFDPKRTSANHHPKVYPSFYCLV